jgi:hypothetical protein
VVVLADPDRGGNNGNGTRVMDALVDADAIFTYNCDEKAQIVIEVIQQQNISYLEAKSSDIYYKFTPNFACGMLFTSSMLDAVVCQVFFLSQSLSSSLSLSLSVSLSLSLSLSLCLPNFL